MQELNGKVALVTGAASGIGAGLVEALAAAGAAIVAADLDAARLTALGAQLAQRGTRHLACPPDIRDRVGWNAVLDRAEHELGPVQLLFNNAGVTATPAGVLEQPAEAWDWVIGTNLTGTFNGAQAVAQRLRRRALPGHIVNTSSIQGLFASAGFAAYNAAKFGIVGLSETLRLELAPHGIGVSVLCPGPTRTGIMANSAKLAPHLAQLKGPPRVGYTIYQTPAQVAAAVLDAVRANRLYVLSHGGYSELLAARAAAIAASLPPESAAALANVREVDAEVLRMYAAAGGTAPAATSGAAGSDTPAAPPRP